MVLTQLDFGNAMNIKLRPIASFFASFTLATAAFAAPQSIEIENKALDSALPVTAQEFSCQVTTNAQGKKQVRISAKLDNADLNSILILKHDVASAILENATECPSLETIVGEVTPENETFVTFKHNLWKRVSPAYDGCVSNKLEETISVSLSTGLELTSQVSRSLNVQCGLTKTK
jgi:hypothetical protein